VWLGSLPLVFGQDKAWKFVLFADTRGSDLVLPINSGILSELARAVVRERPAFVLFGGDYAFWTTGSDLQQWTNIMSPVYAARIPIYPMLGNHEFDRPAFDNMFSLTLPAVAAPGMDFTYSFQFNNALILMLDQYVPTNELRVNQAWLDAILST